MAETYASIAQWVAETFPGRGEPPTHSLRALEEMIEICAADGAHLTEVIDAVARQHRRCRDKGEIGRRELLGSEIAGTVIALAGLAGKYGIDLDAEIEREMAKNRASEWDAHGDGTGHRKRAR
jgi:NTP pyrophosphatase (non-canonical NTP hydrolase)